jgi:hypothetical protein
MIVKMSVGEGNEAWVLTAVMVAQVFTWQIKGRLVQ